MFRQPFLSQYPHPLFIGRVSNVFLCLQVALHPARGWRAQDGAARVSLAGGDADRRLSPGRYPSAVESSGGGGSGVAPSAAALALARKVQMLLTMKLTAVARAMPISWATK